MVQPDIFDFTKTTCPYGKFLLITKLTSLSVMYVRYTFSQPRALALLIIICSLLSSLTWAITSFPCFPHYHNVFTHLTHVISPVRGRSAKLPILRSSVSLPSYLARFIFACIKKNFPEKNDFIPSQYNVYVFPVYTRMCSSVWNLHWKGLVSYRICHYPM